MMAFPAILDGQLSEGQESWGTIVSTTQGNRRLPLFTEEVSEYH